jgi:protein tyrosine/serine phosphatase
VPRPAAAHFAFVLAIYFAGCASTELPGKVGNVHTVVPGVLVRGGQPNAAGLRALRETYAISTVVNLNTVGTGREAKAVTGLGMTYVGLPSSPFRNNPAKLRAFLNVVRDAPRSGPVYVHCQEGMDRTGVAVAVYRVVEQGWDSERALAELRSHQLFPHGLLFPAIKPFVRDVGRHRAEWNRDAATQPPSFAAVPPPMPKEE